MNRSVYYSRSPGWGLLGTDDLRVSFLGSSADNEIFEAWLKTLSGRVLAFLAQVSPATRNRDK